MFEAGEIRLEGTHGSLAMRCPAPRVVTITFEGTDVGELGDAPFRALGKVLARSSVVQLFIDARNATGASIDVSGQWAAWLNQNANRLARVDMLTSTRFVRLTADFVARFSGLGARMHIHGDAAEFERLLNDATEAS